MICSPAASSNFPVYQNQTIGWLSTAFLRFTRHLCTLRACSLVTPHMRGAPNRFLAALSRQKRHGVKGSSVDDVHGCIVGSLHRGFISQRYFLFSRLAVAFTVGIGTLCLTMAQRAYADIAPAQIWISAYSSITSDPEAPVVPSVTNSTHYLNICAQPAPQTLPRSAG
jgi:hypothetical protein